MWLLWLIPLLGGIYLMLFLRRRKKLKMFGDAEIIGSLMPDVSRIRPHVKFVLMLMALALMIMILARPQMGTKVTNEKRNGIETIICLDVSNSMMAEDVSPSRLDKSKMLVENLVEHFTNDKIGLILFAGDAFVQLPITSDYVSAKMFLQTADPSFIAVQGTDIAQALHVAMNSFTQQEKIGRAIIVITDGEDHEGGALEAAKEARKKGINVFILGVGDPKGAPIPLGNGDYMTDAAGQTVMTALNEDMCRQVAQAGSGTYIHVDNTSDAQEKLNDELARLQKAETNSVIYSEYDEQFQAFAIIAILLLIIEAFVFEAKNPLFRKVKLPVIALLLTIGGLSVSENASAQSDRQNIRSGNKLYRSQQFDKAEIEYRKSLTENPRNPQAMYNLGCALMAQQKDSAAIVQFENASKVETSARRRSMIFHNIGWICQKNQLYGEAIEAYKESLRNNPDDHETRYNLALCQRQQKNQPQQNQQNNQNQQNKKDQQDKQDKQDQQQQDKQDKQDKQKQPPKEQMSKENAEQLLNAAMQDEKRTQERMKEAQRKQSRRKLDKNW